MLARSDPHQPVGAEADRLQALRIDAARDDADVGAAVEHAARDPSIRFFLKVDVDARVAREEARQYLGQETGHRRGVGEHAQVAELSSEIVPLSKQTPESLRTHLAAEVEKWGKVIRAAGVQAD